MKKEIKVCLKEYIESFYGNRKPNEETMRKKCKANKIPNAIKEGGRWFIKVEVEETEKKS